MAVRVPPTWMMSIEEGNQLMATISGFILTSVLNRIDRGSQVAPFVVNPVETKYVKGREDQFEQVTVTMERKRKAIGHPYPKLEGR